MLKKILILIFLVLIAVPLWYLFDLPDTTVLRTKNPQTSAIRTFREQQLLKKGKKPYSSMQWRNLDQISPYLRHAVVLAEDDTFYQHNGFDIEQLKRAAKTNWERKRFAFGASTITQQLARSLYLSSRKQLLRKAKEALITRRLEKTLSKKRILELYLNVAEWGPQIYGAEAASRHFFNKSASDLTADEAIALTAILPSPRRWNPLGETKFMVRRRSTLHARMVAGGHIAPVVEVAPTESVIDPNAPVLSVPEQAAPMLEAPADEDDDAEEPEVTQP